MSEENATTQMGGEQGSVGADAHQVRDLEREAGRVISFMESSIPDFIRDAVVDALGEASEIGDLPMPTFDDQEESADERVKMLAKLFERVPSPPLRGEHKESRRKLTPQTAAKLGEGIVQSSEFDEGVIWQLIVLPDEIATSCMDSTRVEDLASAARDSAFALTVEFTRACDLQIAKRRAQWAKVLFDEK
jgi:hypothetical protein